MLIKLNKMLKNNKGFTLIELLVVLAIIAIMVAIVAPRIVTSLDNAQQTSQQAVRKNVENALERYYFDHNSTYTTNTADLVPEYLKENPNAPDNGQQVYNVVITLRGTNSPTVAVTRHQ